MAIKTLDHSANNIFHLAVTEANNEEQSLQVLEVFLKRETDYKEDYKWLLDQRNISGQTPAHLATIRGFGGVVKKFYQHGADLNLKVCESHYTLCFREISREGVY